MFNFDNTYLKLGSEFYKEEQAEHWKSPKIVLLNRELFSSLVNEKMLETDQDELALILTANRVLDGSASAALVYSGHQFGHFNPRLGDGRAMLLGEVITNNGQRLDIHLKGSGQTEYSRGGDGKSPLGPCVREHIISEAMYGLKVPTTRSLAVIETGETVYRDEAEPGAVVCRTAASHIRIGTFEYFASRGLKNDLTKLFNHTVKRHYINDLEINESNTLIADPFEFIKAFVKKNARTTALWLTNGFIHGVMNTDNILISGETIDYGPCAFMDTFKKDQVYSFIDKHGRYAYSNQIHIAKWNCLRLCEALISLIDDDQQKAVNFINENLEPVLREYDNIYLKTFALKFGITETEDSDLGLINSFLTTLENQNLDFTNTFRILTETPDLLGERAEFSEFYKNWKERTKDISKEKLYETMSHINPVFVSRNHLVDKAIKNANKGDFELCESLIESSKDPYSRVHPPEFLLPPEDSEIVRNTFCGT